MLPRIACLTLLVCLVASLAGCAPIEFGEQELTLRHDAKADALDVLIVYSAIQARHADPANEDDLAISRGFATRVSGGRRELMIFDWPMHFDLDKIQEVVRSTLNEGTAEGQQTWAGTNKKSLAIVQGLHNDVTELQKAVKDLQQKVAKLES